MSSIGELCWLLILGVCLLGEDADGHHHFGSPAHCYRKCPYGQHCKIYPYYGEECVNSPHPGSQSCNRVGCPAGQVCLPQVFPCFVPPCPVSYSCFPDRCLTVRCGTGTVCNTRRIAKPTCNDFPQCFYNAVCVPRAEPRPGFCPAPKMVSPAFADKCQFDNDCPPDQLCCASTARDRFCTQPLHPDPCSLILCPPSPYVAGGTCVVRDGIASCADRVCQPGSFFNSNGFQCYCNDAGQVIGTNIPAPQ